MNRMLRLPATIFLTALMVLAAVTPATGEIAPIWTDFDEALLDPAPGTRINVPDLYRVVALDTLALRALLALAPLEFTGGVEAVVPLPMPDGSLALFRVEESPIMEPGLAALHPEIRTYRGQGVADPAATTRFGLTAAGFHAIVLAPSGTVYIDSYSRGDLDHYISYYKRDLPRDPALTWECEVHGSGEDDGSSGLVSNDAASSGARGGMLFGLSSSGGTLRNYRLAQAANFEYTLFHSTGTLPSKADAINFGIIPTINRVNGIYERDLSVHMNLIDELELIVWDTPADPYTNESGANMLVENQVTLDALIGQANYDIGHVFSTGGGGIAFLGVVCDNTIPVQKAGGVTGLPAPIGDPFSVDYVAHEMGHQFAGTHTFNGNAGSCSGNRTASTAYEVGSGSTIQAYAGICGAQNLQAHSDDYFHLISYIQMRNLTTSGVADACAVKIATNNTPPVVEAGTNFTIPKQTPFTLTAVGSDPDGDALTYAWEEFDLGPAGAGTSDNGSSPIFRSFPPVPEPSRTFPKLSDILDNTTTYGELLPTTTRLMNFRVTARDNRAGGGEVCWDSMQVQVVSAAGPFLVVQPNGGEVWTGNAPETVVWDVAGTTAAPVSTPTVDIRLSVDSGLTFPILLAAGVPNSGSATVTAPNLSTTDARIKIEGAGNIFFDLSDDEFTIQPGTGGQPFAADDLVSTAHNTQILIDVLANDSDPDGDPLSIVAVQSPTDQGGAAVIDGDNILYTPALGFSGNDTFTYTISDGFQTDTGSVVVEVGEGGSCEEQPPALSATARADGFMPQSGDGDGFIDNCENADLAFLVANGGGPDLTNVRIVDIRPVSHPEVTIETPLPATVTPSLASSCDPAADPAAASFNFTAAGLGHGDTVLFEVDLTADELAPFSRTFTLELRDAESDVSVGDVTFTFETDEDGWQVVSGTFDRTPGGGAPGSLFFMASSAAEDDACDLVRSPVLRLSSTSTLSLHSQFEIEPESAAYYDRANVGIWDPADATRTVVIPDDGGLRPYNVPDGTANGGCAEGEAGWAGAGPAFLASGWSASALGVDGLGPAGRELQVDFKYATDPSLALGGAQFDQVVVTDVLELVPDQQDDSLCDSELEAIPDSAVTDEDVAVTIDVLANDTVPDGGFVVIQDVTQGANGSVTNNVSDVTYTPNPDYFGADGFTYTICDEARCSSATVSVEVLPVNDPPEAEDDAYSVNEGYTLNVPAPGVLGNDSDVEGDTLSAMLVGDVSNGSLTLNADGSFNYTATAGSCTGSDSFTYRANDGEADSNLATVTVDVDCDGGQPPPCDFCAGGDPVELELTYYGGDCSGSNNTQGDKAECTDFAGPPPTGQAVFIVVSNKEDADADSDDEFFRGPVDPEQVFMASAAFGGKDKLPSKLFVHIFSDDTESGGVLLQSNEIHTSCSAPLIEGERFGAVALGDAANPGECPAVSGGRVHGSGHLNVIPGPGDDEDSDTDADSDSDDDSDSDKVYFSFDAKFKNGELKGKLKLKDKELDIKIEADKDGITSLSTGTGACNGRPLGTTSWEFTAVGTFEQNDVETPATFRVCGEDNGKPGKDNDRFYLECTSGCGYDTGLRVPDDVLEGGNIHIHDALGPPS